MSRAIVSSTARLYGHVVLGNDVIIEDFVVIGHPYATAIKSTLQSTENTDFEEVFRASSTGSVTIGPGTIVRSGSVIYCDVVIGAGSECGHHTLVREGSILGDGVYLKTGAENMKNVRIGDNCRIAGMVADNAVLERNVSSFGSITHEYREHFLRELADEKYPERLNPEAAYLCEGAIVGRNATVVGGVRIGRNARIAAGVTVISDVADEERVLPIAPTRRLANVDLKATR